MSRYVIIADDFTGANDTGVQLRKRGIETEVILDGQSISNENMSYVIDTESRGLSEEAAYHRVKNHIKGIFNKEFEFVYKKVDSTLRGNIVGELKAVDEEFKPELIIFAPAFPTIGRTTINEIHCLNGIRVRDTEISKDPIKPVKEDNIKYILGLGFEEEINHHNLSDIREGNIDFMGARIHSFDSELEEDLLKIIKSALQTEKKILWVGSAGMADCILKIKAPMAPAMAIVGSVSDVSRKQIKYAERKGVNILKINISKLIKGENKEGYVKTSLDILKEGKDLILSSAYDREDYEEAIRVGKEKGLTKEEISIFTQEVLGDIGERILEQIEISGIFLTGGDTAIGFIKKSGALGSTIIQEVATGIPLMKLNGGKFHGLKMITKAGAFGIEEGIEYSMRKLKEEL